MSGWPLESFQTYGPVDLSSNTSGTGYRRSHSRCREAAKTRSETSYIPPKSGGYGFTPSRCPGCRASVVRVRTKAFCVDVDCSAVPYLVHTCPQSERQGTKKCGQDGITPKSLAAWGDPNVVFGFLDRLHIVEEHDGCRTTRIKTTAMLAMPNGQRHCVCYEGFAFKGTLGVVGQEVVGFLAWVDEVGPAKLAIPLLRMRLEVNKRWYDE